MGRENDAAEASRIMVLEGQVQVQAQLIEALLRIGVPRPESVEERSAASAVEGSAVGSPAARGSGVVEPRAAPELPSRKQCSGATHPHLQSAIDALRAQEEFLEQLVSRKSEALTDTVADLRVFCETLGRAAARIEASDFCFRPIIDAMDASVCILDHAGTIIETNVEWNAFSFTNGGHPACTGIGVNYLEVCRRARSECASVGRLAKAVERILNGGTFASYADTYRCDSLTEKRWYQLCVSPIHGDLRARAVIIHANVTGKVMAEQALDANNKRLGYLNLLSKHVDRSVSFLDQSGIVRWVNESSTRLTGYEADEVVGESAWFLKPGDSLPKEEVAFARARLRQGKPFRLEANRESKRGEPFTCKLVAKPISIKEVTPLHFMTVEERVTSD